MGLNGERIDFGKIDKFLLGQPGADDIIRECSKYDTDDLKRVLVSIGRKRCTDSSFVIDDDNRFAYENIFKWCIGDDSILALNPFSGKTEKGSLTKGIYIAGPTGTGKTMCLNIFRTFLDAIGAMVTIAGRGRYMLAWTTFFAGYLSQNCQDFGNVTWTNDYPVICIQDMGSEMKTVNHYGTQSNAIERIIQMRGDQNMLTMITSNYRIQGSPYGNRIESRLCKMCNYYEIKGKDRRR